MEANALQHGDFWQLEDETMEARMRADQPMSQSEIDSWKEFAENKYGKQKKRRPRIDATKRRVTTGSTETIHVLDRTIAKPKRRITASVIVSLKENQRIAERLGHTTGVATETVSLSRAFAMIARWEGTDAFKRSKRRTESVASIQREIKRKAREESQALHAA